MTTEEDFDTALDRNPEDWQTRLVYADWLQERGDPRAEGYRALGTLRRFPSGWEWWTWLGNQRLPHRTHESIGRPWWKAAYNLADYTQVKNGRWGRRKYADDCAALAWSRLTQKLRDAIMKKFSVPT